jgi:hypothetical protein
MKFSLSAVFFIALSVLLSCFNPKGVDPKVEDSVEVPTFLHIDSVRRYCKTCVDSVYQDPSFSLLVKKIGKLPYEIYVFDSSMIFSQYILCTPQGVPKYSMAFDFNLEVLKFSGFPGYIRMRECVENDRDEIEFMVPTPPFFDITVNVYFKYDTSKTYIRRIHHRMRDDVPFLFKDDTFDHNYEARAIISMKHNEYVFRDTFEYERRFCEDGIKPRIMTTQ